MTDTTHRERLADLDASIAETATDLSLKIMATRSRNRGRHIAGLTSDVLRGFVQDEIEPLLETIESLERGVDIERTLTAQAIRARETARENATEDLAALAETAQAFADAHIATITAHAARHVDRFVVNRYDQRERGKR